MQLQAILLMGQLYTACAGGVAAGICLVTMSKVNFTSVHKEMKHANTLTQLEVLIHIIIVSEDQM